MSKILDDVSVSKNLINCLEIFTPCSTFTTFCAEWGRQRAGNQWQACSICTAKRGIHAHQTQRSHLKSQRFIRIWQGYPQVL